MFTEEKRVVTDIDATVPMSVANERTGRAFGRRVEGVGFSVLSLLKRLPRGKGLFVPIREEDLVIEKAVYVSDYSQNKIKVFSLDGTFVFEFGSLGSGDGQFSQPRGITYNYGLDQFFVADSANTRIQVFDRDGNFIKKWDVHQMEGFSPLPPYGVALSDDGYVYVTCNGDEGWTDHVQKTDLDGNFLLKFGTGGYYYAPGQFNRVKDIVVDGDDNILVIDVYHGCIQKFSPNGSWIETWGRSEDIGNFHGLEMDSEGNCYVTVRNPVGSPTAGVYKYADNGDFIGLFQDSVSGEGRTVVPEQPGIAGDDSLYVPDSGGGVEPPQVIVYSSYGDYMFKFGHGWLSTPIGVAIRDLTDN